MTLEELRDRVVEKGIEAAKRDYGRPGMEHKLRGSLAGFEIARTTPLHFEYFEAVLHERDRIERHMKTDNCSREDYWEYRCGTLEVEWVFEVMKVAWRKSPVSARAAMTFQAIVDAAPRQDHG